MPKIRKILVRLRDGRWDRRETDPSWRDPGTVDDNWVNPPSRTHVVSHVMTPEEKRTMIYELRDICSPIAKRLNT
jgi:hypothetical protein